MAKYPIVVVKENPGTPEVGGKLVVEVRWLEEPKHENDRPVEQVLEMKLPKVIGKLRDEAEINGVKVDGKGKTYELELGERDVEIESADPTQC